MIKKRYEVPCDLCGNGLIFKRGFPCLQAGDDNVSCEYYPADGICIMIDEHVCYANIFFDLVEESKNGMIDKGTFIRNCI